MTSIQKKTLSNELKGVLCSPEGEEKLPCVIILHGSDGRVPLEIAESIASQGFLALALGFFGIEGLPPHLENISLEYFLKAIAWVKEQPRLKKNSLVLLGYSRGGELALLLGSLFPHWMNGIIAFAPCDKVCGGFPHPNRPAWLLKNKSAFHYLHGMMSSQDEFTEAEDLSLACEKGVIPFHKNTENDPYDIVDLFLAREKQKEKNAEISVEKILCPILLFAGEQDKIWPSALYGKEIMKRLEEKKSTIQRELFTFPQAGHGIIAPYDGPIYHPVGKFWCRLGGTPTGNKEANHHAWNETFRFLEKFK